MNYKSLRVLLCSLMLIAGNAAHAAWPDRVITIVAPFAPGGNADIQARLAAQALSEKLGQTVVVENRPGAGGMLGAQYVARAKPDGYTFLLGAFANVLGEFFYRKKLLDVRQDLVSVTQVSTIPNYIAVATNSKYNTLKEMLDDAKADSTRVTCATPGVGTAAHLICEMLNQKLGTKMTTISYRGGAPAIVDVMGGQVTFFAGNEGLAYIRDKRLKGLAVTSALRSPLAPDLAPVADLVPGFDLNSWYGLFAPKGTPKDIVDRVNRVVADAIAAPETRDKLATLGATPVGSTPAEFATFIDSEFRRWEPVAKSLNINLD